MEQNQNNLVRRVSIDIKKEISNVIFILNTFEYLLKMHGSGKIRKQTFEKCINITLF